MNPAFRITCFWLLLALAWSMLIMNQSFGVFLVGGALAIAVRDCPPALPGVTSSLKRFHILGLLVSVIVLEAVLMLSNLSDAMFTRCQWILLSIFLGGFIGSDVRNLRRITRPETAREGFSPSA